jgi:hypothetical protein
MKTSKAQLDGWDVELDCLDEKFGMDPSQKWDKKGKGGFPIDSIFKKWPKTDNLNQNGSISAVWMSLSPVAVWS